MRVEVGGAQGCAGALLAVDLVATARHCVSLAGGPLQCPGNDPAALALVDAGTIVVVAGDVGSGPARARVRRVLAPAGDLCTADVALLSLEDPVDSIEPLAVRRVGVARGDHVRAVAFLAANGSPEGTLLVRDHVPVLAVSDSALLLEQPGGLVAGGPAVDETTGELVGLASRPDGAGAEVYVRADALVAFFAQALTQSVAVLPAARGSSVQRAKKGPVDMGAACQQASACAAGLCAIDAVRQYCTRSCSVLDACPSHYRCEKAQASGPEGAEGTEGACAER